MTEQKSDVAKAFAIGRNVERQAIITMIEFILKNAIAGPARGMCEEILGQLYRMSDKQ
jgi:hypothetical protein